jgi:hypothetical protein
MSTVAISLIVFACVFGGAMFGMFLSARLPKHHLNEDSKRVLTLGSGVIATMAALVLGLLVASAKATYDAQNNEALDVSAKIALMDRILGRYGPEASAARRQLRAAFARALDRVWPPSGSPVRHPNLGTSDAAEVLDKIQDLTPSTEAQHLLKSQAISLALDLGKTRFLIYEQQESSVSLPLLGMVVFWMSINFMSFGLFAPRNATVIVAFLFCAFAVAGAIFLIVEMYKPLDGLIHVSSAPLRNVLGQLGN